MAEPARTPQPAAPARPDHIPWTRARVALTGGLMLATFVAAMDATVVGTALPTIAGELRDLSLYPWIFAGYLLTSTTTVPVWGRMADVYGRKRVLLAGLAIFVGGSMACGAAQSMTALIVFRAVQGIGAGCIQPVALTVVGDIFPVAQRARLQGLFSAVWAVAATVGPLIGALFVTTIGWRWTFYVNFPIGIASAALLWGYNDRPETGRRPRVEYVGVVLLTAGVALLLYGMGSGNPSGRPVWPVVPAAVAVLVFFAWREVRSTAPTVPIQLLRNRVIGPAVLFALLSGTVMWGCNTWLPLFVQGAQGATPLAAGWAISPMSLGWPIASTLAGRLMLRIGYERVVVLGGFALVLGTGLLVLTARLGAVAIGIDTFVIGLGMGFGSTPLLITIQNAVEWSSRGAVTALNQFARTIGGAVGVSLMGVLVAARLGGVSASELAARIQPGRGGSPQLATAVEPVFWTLLTLGAASLAVAAGIVAMRRKWAR